MTGQGPCTVAVDFLDGAILEVTCTDPIRGSILDVSRAGSDHREVLEPGKTFTCMIAPGPAELTFGHATIFRFEAAE